MKRPMLWIAAGSLSLSVLCLVAAGAMSDGWGDLPFGPGDWRDRGGPLSDADRSVIEREIPWDGTDGFKINLPAETTFSYGATPRLVARGPAYIVNAIEMSGGEISSTRRRGRGDITLTLVAPSIKSLALNGAGEIKLNDLKEEDLSLSIAGAGDVEATGSVRNVKISIAGMGDIDLSDLVVETTKISISGAGDIKIAPTKEADISIAGAGDVDLLTRPAKLTTHIAGAGDISQPDPDDAPRAPPTPKSSVTVGVGESKITQPAPPPVSAKP